LLHAQAARLHGTAPLAALYANAEWHIPRRTAMDTNGKKAPQPRWDAGFCMMLDWMTYWTFQSTMFSMGATRFISGK